MTVEVTTTTAVGEAPARNADAFEPASRVAGMSMSKTMAVSALADQLRRASYSVVLNIAEGSSRRGSREYRRFLDTANGSLAEVETALGLARELEYLKPADFGRLEALATETGKTLFGLLRKISASAARLPPSSS